MTGSSWATVRTIVVLALALFVLASGLPDIRRVWLQLGTFGIAGVDPNLVITGIKDDSPAAKAGLRVGDRIDIADEDVAHRSWLYVGSGPETPTPGERLTFSVMRGGQRHSVTMVSEPEGLTPTTKTLLVLRELSLLLFVGIGAALVLLRPSIPTWAFYFVCLGLNGAPGQITGISLPTYWGIVAGLFGSSGFIGSAGTVGVLIFAALFLHEQSGGWRRLALRLAPFLWLVLAALDVYLWVGEGWYGLPGNPAFNFGLLLQACIIALALAAFVATYVEARGTDKQRIRWVILGFGIATISSLLVLYLQGIIPLPYWLYASLLFVPVIVPLTVAYAVVRHRIIDVSFVVSRALVYGVLTTLLVGAFSLVDWLFIDKLKLVRLGTLAEMGVAIAGGFWFNGLHRRVDTLIDATFFRQRHRAERLLSQDAQALPLAESSAAIAHFLVAEPTRALTLASAALFRRQRDGTYLREASEGWGGGTVARLDAADDPLLLLARTERGPISLHDHPWRSENVPSGAARPLIAVPIMVRDQLAALVFYGAHVHGETLDPDEIRILGDLANGAAAAYDHLDADALRRENEAMRNEVSSLRVRLAEAEIQPA